MAPCCQVPPSSLCISFYAAALGDSVNAGGGGVGGNCSHLNAVSGLHRVHLELCRCKSIPVPLCLPSATSPATSSAQNLAGQSMGHPELALLAQAALVSQPPMPVLQITTHPPKVSQAPDPVEWYDQAPWSTAPQGLVFGWPTSLEWSCSMAVRDILSRSRKDSIRRYLSKWRRFSWAHQKDGRKPRDFYRSMNNAHYTDYLDYKCPWHICVLWIHEHTLLLIVKGMCQSAAP